MFFLLSSIKGEQPTLNRSPQKPDQLTDGERLIQHPFELLELYLETDEDSALMSLLVKIRDYFLEDLDEVNTTKEVYGLIYWLMADYNVDSRGETLEATADRLGDMDIENDSDLYTDLIFHLKDAVERIYDIELDMD